MSLQSEEENSYKGDNTKDDSFEIHAFAGSYTSIFHSYSCGMDRFSSITNVQEIIVFMILQSDVFRSCSLIIHVTRCLLRQKRLLDDGRIFVDAVSQGICFII